MRIMRLVLNDLRKDAWWILLFGIITSLIFISLTVYFNNYRQIQASNIVIHKLEAKNVYFADVYEKMYLGKDAKSEDSINPDVLREYMRDSFNHDGIGGCSLDVGANNKTTMVPVKYLIGKMTELTSFPFDPADGILCMAKKRVKEQQGETVKLQGETYGIDVLPEDFKEFMRYGMTDSGNHLYVFCPDFEDFLKVAPTWASDSILLDQCVLVDPDPEDMNRFRRTVSAGTGAYSTLESIVHYLSTTDEKGERTHLMYVIFFTIAGVSLVTAMVINLIRLMKRKFSDYAIHHLYGEDYGHSYVRMNLYALGYQSSALFLFLFLMGDNHLLTPGIAIGAVMIVILISLIVSLLLYREFKKNIVVYLRRKTE